MLILLIIPLLIFIPGIADFFYAPGSAFSDLVISHYPNAVFLRQALQSGQGVPLWSPSILSGYPFAADPLSGLWYPPGWLALGLPLPLGFNLAVMLHLLWGGLGLFLWLKSEGLKPQAAILAALTFEAMPKLVSHFAAGHITLVYAVTWTPWLLWAEKAWQQQGSWRRLWASPGVVLGVICLADVRWAFFAGLLWVAYALVGADLGVCPGLGGRIGRTHRCAPTEEDLGRIGRTHRCAPTEEDLGRGGRTHTPVGVPKRYRCAPSLLRIARNVGGLALQVVLAGVIAAPLLLPLVEFTRLSTRAALQPAEAFSLSLPPSRLLGLLFPDPGGMAEWCLYPGSLALILLVVVLLNRALVRRASFWLWVLGLSLVFSLGSAIPGLTGLAYLPGFNLLRVPPRALFLSGLALAVITAVGVDAFLENRDIDKKKVNLLVVGLAGFVLLLAGGVVVLTGRLALNITWGTASLLATAGIILWMVNREQVAKHLAVGLLVICLVNLGVVNYLSLDPRPAARVSGEGEPAAQALRSVSGIFRVYSPSYSLPQQTAARYGLELADGVDPLQLAAYARFMEKATGVPETGYSVTLPPFTAGDPRQDNRFFRPDAKLLGLLNVRFVAAEFDLPGSGLVLREKIGETRIYENPTVLPRAWVQPENLPVGEGVQAANLSELEPNRVNLTAQGPGLLVLAEQVYPGWQVKVDGQRQEIVSVLGFLRGVRLDAGEHQVEFVFHPVSVMVGVGLALLAWGAIILARILR
jgi:hypothetical protein